MFGGDINRAIFSIKLFKVIHLLFIGYFICLLDLNFLHSACGCKVSTLTPKQLSAKRCSYVIVMLCTAETERVQSLRRALAWTDFRSV